MEVYELYTDLSLLENFPVRDDDLEGVLLLQRLGFLNPSIITVTLAIVIHVAFIVFFVV